MKTLILTTLLSLIAASSFATPREFRINANSVTSGVALAWGVKGQLTDFEALEVGPEEEARKFIDQNYSKLGQYLVDVKTNSILAIVNDFDCGENCMNEIEGDFVVGLKNHSHLKIVGAFGPGLGWDQSLIVEITGRKWDSGIGSISLIDRTPGKAQVISTYAQGNEELVKQVLAKLSKKDAAFFDENQISSLELETRTLKDGRDVVAYKIESSVPKAMDQGLIIRGHLQLSVKDKSIFLKVLSATAKRDQ